MWPILAKPPVSVALFQLKYSATQFDLKDFLKYEAQLKHRFPIKKDNIQVGIQLGTSSIPLGVSKVSGTTNAKVDGYIFTTDDQKEKFEISLDTITYISENPYTNWNDFQAAVLSVLSIIFPIVQQTEITRTSIRFLNRFIFDEFEHPNDYLNTVITSTREQDLPYPLRRYGFRLTMDIPDTDIYSIVNHNVENVPQDKYLYTLDIDVLDSQCLLFELDTIRKNMDKLRIVRNTIFFDAITEKVINLCN